MFLTAPLTAFKHDSVAAGFWYSHHFQRCQLAAFPFAAPPNNHQLIISSLLFFLHPPDSHQFQRSVACGSPSFTDCTFFCIHQTTTNFQGLRSLLQLTSNHQLMFLTAPLTAFKHDSEAAGFWHSHNFQRCQLAAFPFAAPQTTTNSLFPACFFFCIHQTATNFNALLPAVHHPSQTALFFALIRQPPIFKGMLAAFPFAATKQPTIHCFQLLRSLYCNFL
ncbi:hypothetical protein OUZ56_033632 [Daphnia magna]|uniref:Uncharacterized protein n=1 Tax=Daphnia magna TaxID=35525 RepID=A0ABQ9ZYC3_9CRUS|nr:hypothetical protein OUZ56_033632 [Daphnia magna]